MPDEPGPLSELAQNLTGSAAGDYGARLGEEDFVATQGPLDDAVSPLERQADETPPATRDEDEDGAPEL